MVSGALLHRQQLQVENSIALIHRTLYDIGILAQHTDDEVILSILLEMRHAQESARREIFDLRDDLKKG